MTGLGRRDIADDLRRRIDAGEWAPGGLLPRMLDLAADYGCQRRTIAEGIKLLEDEGRVLAVQRKGTVVLPPRLRRRLTRGRHVSRRRPKEGGYSFAATQRDEPTWEHHIRPLMGEAPITDRAAELLGVPPGTMVFRRRRVTSPKGETPFTLSDSWILPSVVEQAPEVSGQGPPGGYLDWIEHAGHGPLTWYELTRARMPTKEEAGLLQVPARVPVMEITRVAVSALLGDPVDVTVMVIPSDRVETISHLERDRSARWPTEIPLGGGGSYKEP